LSPRANSKDSVIDQRNKYVSAVLARGRPDFSETEQHTVCLG